jgi:hypothetical protein
MHTKHIMSLFVLLAVAVGCASPKLQDTSEMSRIDRGRSLIMSMGCNDCHTPGYQIRNSVPEEDWLVGGTLGFRDPTGTTYPNNLRLLLNSMSEDDWTVFALQMRKNVPMESVLLPTTSEQDLRAIYQFVKYLGPKGNPAPPRLPAGVTPTTEYIEFPYIH